MAWINVHEDVDGPKLRDLAKRSGLSKNESLGTLILLWLWGIKNADQNGLIRSADRKDVADVISTGLTDGVSGIHVVNCLVDSGWIDEQGGELYLHDWDEWQEMWYRYLNNKEREAARKRAAREREKAEAAPNTTPAEPAPALAPPPAPKIAELPPKPKKKKYAEFVHLEESEYERLVERYGKKAADKMIEKLDNYKGSKHKKYNSDYRAILNWVVESVRKEFPGLITTEDDGLDSENPYGDWSEPDG